MLCCPTSTPQHLQVIVLPVEMRREQTGHRVTARSSIRWFLDVFYQTLVFKDLRGQKNSLLFIYRCNKSNGALRCFKHATGQLRFWYHFRTLIAWGCYTMWSNICHSSGGCVPRHLISLKRAPFWWLPEKWHKVIVITSPVAWINLLVWNTCLLWPFLKLDAKNNLNVRKKRLDIKTWFWWTHIYMKLP